MDGSSIVCDEVVDSDPQGKSNDETKTVSKNFNEKKENCKTQNLYFTCIFINYYSIIDNC